MSDKLVFRTRENRYECLEKQENPEDEGDEEVNSNGLKLHQFTYLLLSLVFMFVGSLVMFFGEKREECYAPISRTCTKFRIKKIKRFKLNKIGSK